MDHSFSTLLDLAQRVADHGFLAAWFISLALLEGIYLKFFRKEEYPWKQFFSCSGIRLLTWLVHISPFWAMFHIIMPLRQHIHDHYRLFNIPNNWFTLFALWFLIEFVWYWSHRIGHKIRWMWMWHATHHTPKYFNASVSNAQGPLPGLSLWPVINFYWLAFLGFDPDMITIVAAGTYPITDFLVHNGLGWRFPKWYEYIFVTANFHRVHHSSDPAYYNSNFASFLGIFDRIFGTYKEVPREAKLAYGLSPQEVNSDNPLVLTYFDYIKLVKQLSRARSFKAVFMYLFGPPGWEQTPAGKEGAELQKSSDRFLLRAG